MLFTRDSALSLKYLEQALLESALWAILIQTLLTGIYIIIFVQTIHILLTARERAYAGILALIFVAIMVNLAAYWRNIRDGLIVNNDSRDTMAFEYLSPNVAVGVVLNLSARGAILLADIIMMWRCYTLWARNKKLLLIFVLVFLGQFVLFAKLNFPRLSPMDVNVGGPAYCLISSVITVLATVLIILRIVPVIKQSEEEVSKYTLIIEVVVESGVLYATSLIILTILYMVVKGESSKGELSIEEVKLGIAVSVWQQSLVPITGIAPTLTALRIATRRARNEAAWPQSTPRSFLQFNTMPPDAIRSANDEKDAFGGSVEQSCPQHSTRKSSQQASLDGRPPGSEGRANDGARTSPPQKVTLSGGD